MSTSVVSWAREQAVLDPELGVAVQAAFYGEVEVVGAWPAALEWLQHGLAAVAVEAYTALRIAPGFGADELARWSSEMLRRANRTLEPHGMKALSIVRLEVSVSRESSTAIRDIQAAIARAKDETQRRTGRG